MITNPGTPIENLIIGKIIEIDGTHIVAELDTAIKDLIRVYGGETYPIGQFGSIIKIHFGRKILYGFVGRLRMKAEYIAEKGLDLTGASDNERVVEADLFGEGEWVSEKDDENTNKWKLVFDRGVTTFPLPQQNVYLTPSSELKYIYGHGKSSVFKIGEHVGSGGTACLADLNELLGKHTAILGSTGSGKSGAVSVILHSILNHGANQNLSSWKPRIVVFDPHNEYESAFRDYCKRLSSDENTLSLPYWLLNLEESIDLYIGKTEFVATSQANIVKVALLKAKQEGATSISIDSSQITVDAPVPYNLDRFVELINEQRPQNKNQKDHEPFDKIINKLEVLRRDSRLRFLMSNWDGESDPIQSILNQFISSSTPICIIDLSGTPNEVAGIVSSVIARTIFNLKIWESESERSQNPILLVCEEAHRYVPNRGEAAYESAQSAIRRIAKEGRKYGIGLLLVSQRPSEIEGTVLSQCNSWLVLRLTNELDKSQIRSMLPDSLDGLIKVLSGLRQREAIFVGQAAILPSRILLNKLEAHELPRSNDLDFQKAWSGDFPSEDQLLSIANRWRTLKKD
jgi:DNA helicase HerA-like ATPase